MINQEGKIGLALLTDEGISIREKLSLGWLLKGEILGNFKEVSYWRDLKTRFSDYYEISKCVR